ncbi:MAG: SO_0444 family Cu/Zn efflux transporter [Gammaproteobacteria bacterium]|nr:SO_0444 family Cu/Zn efflux transporter [Gammaproteobacteria bacterium]
MHLFTTFVEATLHLYLEAAPWLIFGLVIAGMIKAWLPRSFIERTLGGEGPLPIIRAALIGAPIPLCSCGVVPVALSLRRSGASPGSTVSFLVSTPETGADSIAISYAMLGPFMATVRPIASIFSAIFTGLITLWFGQERQQPQPPIATTGGCCSSGSCSSAPKKEEEERFTLSQGVRYAIDSILDDIQLWLVIGIAIAAALTTLLPPDALSGYSDHLLMMVGMVIISIPMYICATASTPVAAGLLLVGVSPGAVMVFLLAGPATNLGTVAIIRRELGNRIVALYLGGMVVASLFFGVVTNLLADYFAINTVTEISNSGEFIPLWLSWGSALLLTALMIRPLRRLLLGTLGQTHPQTSPIL